MPHTIMLLALTIFSIAFLSPAAGAAGGLQGGTATVDITPQQWPLLVRGSFTPQPASSAHDPLHVRCLMLDDGTTSVVLAMVDSCMVHRDVLDTAKKRASAATGIPTENMLIAATHTHSAPYANAQHETPEEIAYQKRLFEGIVTAITQASQDRQPVKIGWSSHELADEVFNRRWFLKPGTVPTNPFGEDTDLVKMNPPRGGNQLINPAGPVDPELSVLYVTDLPGRPLAVLANYALHYVGNTGDEVSADYFGEFARLMPVRLGRTAPGFVAMMSNGTSGDINNINFRNPRPPREPYEQIRIVASKAADAATLAIGTIDAMSSDCTLGMRQREITLQHRTISAEQIARARNIVARDVANDQDLPRLARSYAERTLELAEQPPTTQVLLQAIRIGDLAICTMPFEVLVEIGLELKRTSPSGDTFIIELANGGYGYLPTPEQHHFGGYETWLTTNKVQKDASVILVDNLQEMLSELFSPPDALAAERGSQAAEKQ